MPSKEQILRNPDTGDMYEFLETAKDTNGQRVTMKMALQSKGVQVPNHYHALQDEHFEVISGKLTILFDGKVRVVFPAEKTTLPKNKPHNHYNSDDEAVVYIQSVTPALDFAGKHHRAYHRWKNAQWKSSISAGIGDIKVPGQ